MGLPKERWMWSPVVGSQLLVVTWLQAVKTFNQRRMQFDLRFETDHLQHLASCLPSSERLALEAFGGDSVRYGPECSEPVSTIARTPSHRSADVLLGVADREGATHEPPLGSATGEVWSRYFSDYMKGATALVLKRPLLTRSPRCLPKNH